LRGNFEKKILRKRKKNSTKIEKKNIFYKNKREKAFESFLTYFLKAFKSSLSFSFCSPGGA
jgi:hypothetical protein